MAVPHNSAKGLLSLPEDLFTEIILELPAREVIYLSLTCRGLFYGALSRYNPFLWYRVGGFREHGIPGYSEKWYWPQNSMLPVVAPQKSGIAVSSSACRVAPWPESDPAPPRVPESSPQRYPEPGFPMTGVNRTTFRMEETLELSGDTGVKGIRLSDFKESVQFAKPLPYTTAQGEQILVFPDYKRLLTDTMLGLTERGCQWCLLLAKGGSEARSCPQLDMRLCDWCYSPNVLSWDAVQRLEQKFLEQKRPFDTKQILKKQKQPLEDHVFGPNTVHLKNLGRRDYKRFQGVWKPLTARVLRAQFGEEVAREHFVKTELEVEYDLALEQLPSQMPDQVVLCLRDREDMDF